MSRYRRQSLVERVPLHILLGGAILLAGTLMGCGGDAAEGSGTPSAQAAPGATGAPVAAVGLGGAEGAGSAERGGGAVGVPGATGGPGAEGVEPASPAAAQPAPQTIYYDLTTYDWYRRGEDLLFEGRSYRPAAVRPTGELRLEREGAYDGVDFYVPRGGAVPHDTLYVPVYNGYWLAFALAGGGEGETR